MTARQREVWFGPSFFGQMVVVYTNDRAVVVYEGTCNAPSKYRIVAATPTRVETETAEGERSEMLLFDDSYSLPIEMGSVNGREVFSRVSLDEVLRQFPCIAAALPEVTN